MCLVSLLRNERESYGIGLKINNVSSDPEAAVRVCGQKAARPLYSREMASLKEVQWHEVHVKTAGQESSEF